MDLEWLDALHERHRKSLTFQELRKGVVALSRIYVENREGLEKGKVFDGAAKRAAFACYYAPLHFLFVREVARALELERTKPRRIVDLGCGLATAGAALATVVSSSPRFVGYEKNVWAASAARRLLPALGIRGRIHHKPLQSAPAPEPGDLVVAAFAINELGPSERANLLARLLGDTRGKASILVLEPIARRPVPWWDEWNEAFRRLGGRDDAWRFPVELPDLLAALDRASGLDHRVLTGRSLFLRKRA